MSAFLFQFKGDCISQGAWVWSMPKNWFTESRGCDGLLLVAPRDCTSSFRSIILRTVGSDTPRTFATSATDRIGVDLINHVSLFQELLFSVAGCKLRTSILTSVDKLIRLG